MLIRSGLLRLSGPLILVTLGALLPAASTDEARAAGEHWLALVDAQKYGESWSEASSVFRARVSQQQWMEAAKGAREPFGALLSRKVQSAAAAKTLPGAPDGECVVFRFETSFQLKSSAVETLTMTLDAGHWRAAGYFVK